MDFRELYPFICTSQHGSFFLSFLGVRLRGHDYLKYFAPLTRCDAATSPTRGEVKKFRGSGRKILYLFERMHDETKLVT